jgi:hypothetical protein
MTCTRVAELEGESYESSLPSSFLRRQSHTGLHALAASRVGCNMLYLLHGVGLRKQSCTPFLLLHESRLCNRLAPILRLPSSAHQTPRYPRANCS